MSDLSTTDIDSIFLENAEVAESHNRACKLQFMNVVTGNNVKNDIKVSEEGVAKLTFGFLDDMQGGDSSLEPGEVKTPPPGSKPCILKESTPSRLAQDNPEPRPAKQLAKETLAKALKTVSQLEAEACEEKVRSILELDAKRRKEEAEKRKLEAEKRRQSGEIDIELENKRKAKEERKQLKKLKRAKKAAEKALISFDEDNKEKSHRKKSKTNRAIESEESEGLCSSGAEDDELVAAPAEKHGSMLSSTIAIPSVPPLRYPPHLSLPHLLPDAFMGGFRPMNPFLRGPRPDFSHGRGVFISRGRGGMRARMPFPGFRPPFFPNSIGGGQLKFNVPHGPHVIQQQRHPHTPPPNRGHSPILPPTSDLQWTKCKPSLSYAFKFIKEQKFHDIHPDVKFHNQNISQTEENWDDEVDPEKGDGYQQDGHPKLQHEKIHKKEKKHKSIAKEKKKSKKQREKDVKKSKRNRISLDSTTSSLKQKKKSSISSRRQIEKIRKSYSSSSRSTPTQQRSLSFEDTETTTEQTQNAEDANQETNEQNEESEKLPSEEEIRNKVENIKKEKIETTPLKIKDLTLNVKPFIMIKTEPQEKETQQKKENEEMSKNAAVKFVDIFAKSPPLSVSSTAETKQTKSPTPEKHCAELGSVTPPLPPINNDPKGHRSSLQNALEIQKRIDKLLQQDDLKLEAIEAAKDLLMKKTQVYQSSKDKLTPERESHKLIETKSSESAKTPSNKEESYTTKEKPKAYKDKESNKKIKESDIEKEKQRNSSKHSEEKDVKLKDKSTTSSSKDKSKDVKKTKDCDKDKDKTSNSQKTDEKSKSRKEKPTSTYRNPFKRSLSRDRFFGKIDSHRRTRTKSRERDTAAKRRLSNDRKRADSSGYSSSKTSSKRRYSGSSTASTILNRSKSIDREEKASTDLVSSKEKDGKDRNKEKTPELKHKRKHSASPKRKSGKEKDLLIKTKHCDKAPQAEFKSTTPPPKIVKNKEKHQFRENKKHKSPIKSAPKKRPLSFTQTEFLFPEEGIDDDFILGDDDETSDSFKNISDKEDSPDTDDYMDNWENDEDVDLDVNSNMPADISTPRKLQPVMREEDSLLTRFANPSPPKELLEKHAETKTKIEHEPYCDDAVPLTPPLDLLKTLPGFSQSNNTKQEINTPTKHSSDPKKTELFGMQELYDQFIKSVEATGVSMKTANNEQAQETEEIVLEKAGISNNTGKCTQNQSEDRLSTSSTSTSSSNSSSSSSSSESNSSSNSSSSSSSESSSEDSNDVEEFTKSNKQTTTKIKLEKLTSPKSTLITHKILNDTAYDAAKSSNTASDETREREPRTPSPSPLQKSLLISQTPPTPSSQNKSTPKTDVAKDFKKLKNLEANLSRIQMMRANYDSNDEISEELHKMEMLFLQEKKLILQKYAKNTQAAEKPATTSEATKTSEVKPALPPNEFVALPPPPPPEELNKIFDANREAIKLTISPMKLSSKPAIFDVSLTEETEKKVSDDKDEIDFTEKLIKPAKEVAIVKPMMETQELKESRTRDSHRHRRSPVYSGNRDRQRSPNNYRDRNRRSSSRNRLSPQRRGRGRSLSISPPRRGLGVRQGTPPRRGAPGSRFRALNRRSRSRSRSPLRQFGNRRGKEGSPFRRKRGSQHELQTHYKKFGRHRSSRSRSPRSPQTRPRSPRTPPPRRRSFSPDPYSRSPLPFKPPSPPMRRSLSPMDSSNSPTRRSRSPTSSRRPRSPRSPISPRSPLSPRSPRSPDSPPSQRYDDQRYRRENSFDRHSSISPHPQYYAPDSLASSASSQASPYYYNVSPSRISLDARINIVLNTPGGGGDTPPVGYEGYTNYAQYGGAAYMSLPPQPVANSANNMGYYPNPYVPMMASTHEGHHSMLPPHAHGMQHSLHPTQQQQQHAPAYSNIPTINSGVPGSSSPLPPNNFYYNDFNVLKELPKATVAVQKGNVLEIVPSNVESANSPHIDNTKTSPVLVETIKSHIDKIASISWKDEVNNRHVKSAVMRLNRCSDNVNRSILKCSTANENPEQTEKKKVYFEDGIYPSRDSDDEDRKLIEYKIRKKALRLRKKRGIDVPAARDLIDAAVKLQKPKIDAVLEKLPPPPPPATAPPPTAEQPIYLRPPTPVPLVYFHFDSVVHSMYVSQLEKAIPPRLLNPKCVPPGAAPPASTTGTGNVGAANSTSTSTAPNHSPNINLSTGGPTTKKELSTLAALNRIGRNENVMNSPKTPADAKRESPNSQQQSPIMTINKPSGGMHFIPAQISPQMPPLHGPAIRHPPSPIGFVGMRINNFMRLPPSPLARPGVPPHLQAPPPHMLNLPHGMLGMRHPHYNMPPPNLMPPGMQPDGNYNTATGGLPYGPIPTPPPGFQGYGQRPMNPRYFMASATSRTMHLPPPMPANSHAKDKDHMIHHQQHHHHLHHHHPQHHHSPHLLPHLHPHQQQQKHHHGQHKPPPPLSQVNSSGDGGAIAASPQAMIAPYNVKKTVN